MSNESGSSTGLLRDIVQLVADEPKTAIGTVVVGFLIIFIVNTFRAWYRLSHVPGPFFASFSRLWLLRASMRAQQPMEIQAANEKYGSLVRIGPNELATDDAKLLKRIHSGRSSYTRGLGFESMRFEPGKDNLFSMRDEEGHRKLRNKMAAGYSGKENPSLEGSVDSVIASFITLLETKYLSTENEYRPMDFAEKAQFFTLDVISDLAFGQPFGYLTKDEDVFDFLKITRAFFPFTVTIGNLPWMISLLHSRLFSGLVPKDTDKVGFGAFIGVAKKKVAERYAPDAASHADMLGSFIKNGLDQEQTSRESLLNVVAGSETTATTIRIIMLCILTNPAAYRRLQQEIDDAARAGTISTPITDAEARNLPFLQATIQEGLRFKNPATAPLYKEVPKEGDTINGMFIPGGTQIGISAFGVYHSKKVFGPDATVFRPERWLTAEPEQLELMAESVALVFSSGKWQCLGKPVAIMELNKIFVELLRRFDFSIVKPEKPLDIFNAGVWIIENFNVRITRREIQAYPCVTKLGLD
ncbi:hypothetical protein FVEN_g9720 [Fusarium venenatum]|uniref:Pisatin demethylase n=2 Tax=Fusarium venenatum TaxID=56646 RepID=A0A2L2U422_9HYPO|nr:uncharacterized protein FVRRES_10977 [Fusarium venenatum]KAG8352233.1 hypothetical protein FVEN_g9720 [Fusarium venenatum]CEI70900.1 unnamed protein product [Fusarium venenatum]